MSESIYTPGPWHYCGEGRKDRKPCVCRQVWSTDHPICVVESGPWGDSWPAIRVEPGIGGKAEAFMEFSEYGSIDKEVADANIRLIAAAPEMLEVLKRLLKSSRDAEECDVDQCPSYCKWCAVRAIILKAEGATAHE